jgi:aminoglycoside 2'-N-acetyltransferase I
MTDADWEHALGGMHALAWEDGVLVGHAAVIQRRLWLGGRALRTGYVEGVGVRADRRRRGIGAALMEPLEHVIRGAYDLGALGTTEAGRGFYEARGWRLWQGPSSALTPRGIEPTPADDGGLYVLPVTVKLDLGSPITADWRDSDVW